MNDILNSEDFADFCENYNCDKDCPLNGTGYSCSSRFYKIKFEAEKSKVEKLRKCVEFYKDNTNLECTKCAVFAEKTLEEIEG